VPVLVLAANDGGHLAQLRALAPHLPLTGEPLWVTAPTPQSRSMLDGERVHWIDPAPTRDWRAALRNARSVRRLFEEEEVVAAVSTGSSVALSTLPWAARHRIPAHYIESVTRAEGFSLTGRILHRTPGVRTYTQWPHLAGDGWAHAGSVLDGLRVQRGDGHPVRRMVVSLGTSKFGFRRLVERLVQVVPADVDVLWQTGATDVSGLGIDAREAVPEAELVAAVRGSDAVVAHAGAGIALSILHSGKMPILVPRCARHREHVDDHQEQIARGLLDAGLALVSSIDDLAWSTIRDATSWSVESADDRAPLRLA